MLFLFSCSKEIVENRNSDNEILHFRTEVQMKQELSAVLKMTTEEKSNWALTNGFNSYGVQADLFYDKIDPDSFKSEEEIIQFVNKSKYLEIRTDDQGEKSVEIISGDNSLRYFINDDKCFTVADKAIKIINENTVYTCIDNLKELKSIEDISQIADNPAYFVKSPQMLYLKSINSSCTWDTEPDTKTVAVGRYRISMNIWVTYDNNGGQTNTDLGYKIKSQKRSIFWFAYTTSIKYDIDMVSLHTNIQNPLNTGKKLDDQGTKVASSIEDNFYSTLDFYSAYNPEVHWSYYHNSASIRDEEVEVTMDCGL